MYNFVLMNVAGRSCRVPVTTFATYPLLLCLNMFTHVKVLLNIYVIISQTIHRVDGEKRRGSNYVWHWMYRNMFKWIKTEGGNA